MEKTEETNGYKISVPIENGNIEKKGIPSVKNQNPSSLLDKLSTRLIFKVNKPLIPLKVTLFFWFGAAAVLQPFTGLHLKQLGLSVKNLSIIYMISPFCQFTGTTVSGIIADKIGRSKPVLHANLILAMLAGTSMLFIPAQKPSNCKQDEIYCHSNVTDYMKMTTICSVRSNNSRAFNCTFHCLSNIKDSCFRNYISSCVLLSKYNLSLSTETFEHQMFTMCVDELPEENIASNDLWCLNHKIKKCIWSCKENINAHKEHDSCKYDEGQTKLFALSCVLMILFNTFFTCCYRIVDVTSMSAVKMHNSDYGTQRIWSILGLSIFAPISGYLITLTSSDAENQKYDVAFYAFDAMAFVTICAVWKLDVKMEPPAKDMLKKMAHLLKNVDTVLFLAVVLVIGTAWGFEIKFYAWYLQDLNAPSSLIGLVSTVSGLVGLPFLLTSKWFVATLGSSNLLILALLGHAGFCISYSFLQNPWWSLPCEAFGILTYHLLWVTVVTHTYEVAPKGLSSAIVSVAGGIHFSLGIGTGSLIGGVTMSKYGGRAAFRLVAVICIGTSVLYGLYLLCRRRIWKRELDLEKRENEKSTAGELPQKFIPQLFL